MRYTSHKYLARLGHWLLAIAVIVLGASGLQIFYAFPSFSAPLPTPQDLPLPTAVAYLAIGEWLGGALAWHFTFAWIFAAGLIAYAIDLARAGWRRIWLSRDEWAGILPMARHYFLRGPKPGQTALYNPLQKFAYLSMTATFFAVFATGVLLMQPTQFAWLTAEPWAWQTIRIAHFGCLIAFASFLPGHLIMVALAGKPAMRSMLTGRSDAPGAPATIEASLR